VDPTCCRQDSDCTDEDFCTAAKVFYQTVYGLQGDALTSALARCPAY
jgi:hypothetical protein